MKFLYYDLIFLVLFCVVVAVFLIKHKKNVVVEGKIFVLYKTKFGIWLINKIGGNKSKRSKKFFNISSVIVIFFGYILMLSVIYLFYQLIKMLISLPALIKIIKIPPIMPLVPYLPQMFKTDYLPPLYFTYWIVAIGVVAIFHEFFHGIFSKNAGVRVKSTGFGFLGPFLAAFVEPDEKQLSKKPIKSQLTVMAAGSFANLLLFVVFGLLMLLFFFSFYAPAGINYNTYSISRVNLSSVDNIGGFALNQDQKLSLDNFSLFLNSIENKTQGDLNVNSGGVTLSMIKILADNNTYYYNLITLKSDALLIKSEKLNNTFVFYDNSPALRANLSDPIIKINSVSVKNVSGFKNELNKYPAGSEITIETLSGNYSVTLDKNPRNNSQVFLGVDYIIIQRKGLMGFVDKTILKFKNPVVYYQAKGGEFSRDLIIFIYNLFLWLVLINLSVALVNMLPLGMFDGGRFFYLSIFGLTKSKKIAMFFYRIATWIILLTFILLTVFWFINM